MSENTSEKGPVLGWEEWVSLSDLSLPAIKAKIDTGTKTSALHAIAIEPFGTDENPQVRFIMNPDPSDPTIEVVCSAKTIDRRQVTSSNGTSELRYVIRVTISIGGQCWPIEVSLTTAKPWVTVCFWDARPFRKTQPCGQIQAFNSPFSATVFTAKNRDENLSRNVPYVLEY